MMLRNTFLLFFFVSISLCFFSACVEAGEPAGENEASAPATTADTSESGAYDPELARELGADEYGMKKYVMAFLKRGPNRDRSPEEAQALQKAHLDNIGRMAKAGQLVLAGPFLDDGEIRGIYIFDVETIEEAQALTETDPAIQAGSLVMELHPWYGSAALMKLSEIYPKLQR